MGHKTSPRRTGEMKRQVVRWSFQMTVKNTKKGKQKMSMAVHTPPAW